VKNRDRERSVTICQNVIPPSMSKSVKDANRRPTYTRPKAPGSDFDGRSGGPAKDALGGSLAWSDGLGVEKAVEKDLSWPKSRPRDARTPRDGGTSAFVACSLYVCLERIGSRGGFALKTRASRLPLLAFWPTRLEVGLAVEPEPDLSKTGRLTNPRPFRFGTNFKKRKHRPCSRHRLFDSTGPCKASSAATCPASARSLTKPLVRPLSRAREEPSGRPLQGLFRGHLPGLCAATCVAFFKAPLKLSRRVPCKRPGRRGDSEGPSERPSERLSERLSRGRRRGAAVEGPAAE